MPDVYFIGAGPGDPELITVKGKRLIEEADVVLYAGSLVPRELMACAKQDAIVLDSAAMNLEETNRVLVETAAAGRMAVRVHTGDPSIYGAIREQMRLLDKAGVTYEVVPGVTAAFAGAAAAAMSYTVPDNTQTLIITRLAGRTPVPESENLRDLARHGTAMAIYLSAGDPEGVASELRAAGLADETVMVLAHRVGWPGETVIPTTLGAVAQTARDNDMTRQTVFLVFPGEDNLDHASKLYDESFAHGFRA